jgi:hypothetical protein
VLLVLEVVEGKLAGERFEIGQDGVDIIRKPTGIVFSVLYSFFHFPPRKPAGILLLPYVKKKIGQDDV